MRGFATKFYTQEGNWDIVGNNIPVFFIQESIKFPDFVHAVKPEPHNEVPQGQSAHNNFWDFAGLQPEGKVAPTSLWLPSICSWTSYDKRPTWSCGPCLIGQSRGPSG